MISPLANSNLSNVKCRRVAAEPNSLKGFSGMWAGKPMPRHQYLESENQYNVFAAELIAVQLALEMLRDDWQNTTCVEYTQTAKLL